MWSCAMCCPAGARVMCKGNKKSRNVGCMYLGAAAVDLTILSCVIAEWICASYVGFMGSCGGPVGSCLGVAV